MIRKWELLPRWAETSGVVEMRPIDRQDDRQMWRPYQHEFSAEKDWRSPSQPDDLYTDAIISNSYATVRNYLSVAKNCVLYVGANG